MASFAVLGRRDQLRLPLRDRRAVLQLPTAGGRVAAQLPGDCRRGTSQPASDLPHPDSLTIEDRDLLALPKREVPARRLGEQREYLTTEAALKAIAAEE